MCKSKLGVIPKTIVVIFELLLCGRNHRHRGGVPVPEGGHHHERLQPSQCALSAGNLPAQRRLASRRVALHEARRSAQLHQRWRSRMWCQHHRARFTNSSYQRKPSLGVKIVLSGFTKDAQWKNIVDTVIFAPDLIEYAFVGVAPLKSFKMNHTMRFTNIWACQITSICAII